MKKILFFSLILVLLHFYIFSSPLENPTWGFSLDLPEGYEYSGGDGKTSFSF
jgi:hypothetical protein